MAKAKEIKTAAQVVRSIRDKDRYSSAEERQHREAVLREQARLESYEDLRDDVLSVVKNSGLSFEDIHGKCGPHPSTLENWAHDRVHQPRLSKMQSALRIVGFDIGVIPGRRHPDKEAAE
jgi:hypothetical protein